jgi:hypothetical protein
MKAGKITAKLRDAVQIRFMQDGKEVKMYKNIEMPDALKELEIMDFRFHVDGEKITFQLFFDKGILPAVFPPERAKVTRADKAAAKAEAPAPISAATDSKTPQNPAPVVIPNDKPDTPAKPDPTSTKPGTDTKPTVIPAPPKTPAPAPIPAAKDTKPGADSKTPPPAPTPPIIPPAPGKPAPKTPKDSKPEKLPPAAKPPAPPETKPGTAAKDTAPPADDKKPAIPADKK